MIIKRNIVVCLLLVNSSFGMELQLMLQKKHNEQEDNLVLYFQDMLMILKDASLTKHDLVSQETIDSACSKEVRAMLQKKYDEQEGK